MTPQEQQMLQDLSERVNQTILSDKDPDAERFIFEKLGRNSDSLYILSQTVLVQQYALNQSKKQLDDLKQQLDQARSQAQQPAKHTSFLGSLLGQSDVPVPPPPPLPAPAPYQQVPNYQAPGYAQPAYAQPAYVQPPTFGAPQSGGFLRSAMQTATGVAAGALAFEGIESLMHGFGHQSGFGSGFGDMGSGNRSGEVVNNYYGDNGQRGDLADRFSGAGDQPSSDIEDRRDDIADSTGADNYGTDADPSEDTSSFDDSQGDDSSSFDSGSDDSSN